MDNVAKPIPAYEAMAERWELLDDLLGGTLAMRAAGRRWLPQEPRESDAQYQTRLSRSVLYEGFGEAIARLVAKPYSRPVTVAGDALPQWIAELESDADGAGRTLTDVARESFCDAVTYGLSHFLVDMPRVDGELTVEDARQLGIRPILRHIRARDVIGWFAPRDPLTGHRRLVEVRIAESVDLRSGDFGVQTVRLVRVWRAPIGGEKGTWELWRQREEDGDEYELIDQGVHDFAEIPLVTWYARRTGYMTGRPPLEAIGWLNLRHWQSSSDQANILRFMRTGTLAATGVNERELKQQGGIAVGANQLLWSASPEAKFYVVEHSGAAVKSGENDLRHLEALMETLGMLPMMELSRDATATSQRIQSGERVTTAQAWIRSEEQALEAAFQIAAEAMGDALPDDFSVDIYSDFGASISDNDDLSTLLQMRVSGEITRRTFLREAQRRGLLSEALDVESEALDAARESMPVGFRGGAETP